MTLGTAVLLLILALAGIALIGKFPRGKRGVRIACIVLLTLAALFCAAYIGLTVFFVDAVRNQPPA